MLENSSFACRVVNVWNSVPAECTNFRSLTSFRLSLLNVDFSKFLTIDCIVLGTSDEKLLERRF